MQRIINVYIQWLWVKNLQGELKSLYDDIISAVDDFFDQWDLSTATPMKEECEP